MPDLIGQSFTVGSVNDLCVLEFDFDPAGDFVSFNYIFGSSEYPTMQVNGTDTTYNGGYVNTQFNDIFSYFLSGEGITGPYDAPAGFPGQAVNIATLPGSDPPLPITISSVNNELNPHYYIGVSPDANGTDICMNGHTTVLTAVYPVICGETYHINWPSGMVRMVSWIRSLFWRKEALVRPSRRPLNRKLPQSVILIPMTTM